MAGNHYRDYVCDYNNSVNQTLALTNIIQCEDYESCKDYTQLINSNANASIWCTADGGCEDVSNMVLNGTQAKSVHCDGYDTCQYSSINIANGANMYLSGLWSCKLCTITATSTSDVFCTAQRSCELAEITTLNNLCCFAISSCQNARVTKQHIYMATKQVFISPLTIFWVMCVVMDLKLVTDRIGKVLEVIFMQLVIEHLQIQ